MTIETIGVFSGEVSPTDIKLATKINELVAAVNEQQLRLDNFKCWLVALENAKKPTISKMENVDPYAEQRKWIGCLCKFWNEDKTDCEYGILEIIDEEQDYKPYWNNSSNMWFSHCEPVKPTDDIIFKEE